MLWCHHSQSPELQRQWNDWADARIANALDVMVDETVSYVKECVINPLKLEIGLLRAEIAELTKQKSKLKRRSNAA